MKKNIQRRGASIYAAFFPRILFSAYDFRWEGAVEFDGEAHDYYELVYVADGTATVTEEERVFTLTRGSALLHAPMQFHRIRTDTGARVMVLSFSADVAAPPQLTEGVLRLTEEQAATYEQLFAAARRVYYADVRAVSYHENCTDLPGARPREEEKAVSPLFAAECVLRLGAFLLSLAAADAACAEAEETSGAAREYRAIAAWMRMHADEPLTLAQIAAQFHTSISRIKMLFARHAGVGPKQFFLRHRTERCCAFLAEDTLSERQIAERMGFSSGAYFSLFFKQQTGLTPSEYRRNLRGAKT